jgi:hypothetical protein
MAGMIPPPPDHVPENGMGVEVALGDLLTILDASEQRLSALAWEASRTIDRRHIMAEYDRLHTAVNRIRHTIREGF